MRHGKKFNHLGRKKGHRRALLKNMACSLVEHKRINTTVAKAKALRGYIEPLVTKAKTNSTHSRRVVFSYLQNKEAIKELFGPIADKVASRPGGYVRVIKTGFRKGDGAEMAMIEFVDFNNDYAAGKSGGSGKAKKRRSRRGSGKKTAAAAAGAVAATGAAAATVVEDAVDEVQETVVETVVEETPIVEAAAPVVTEEVITETVVVNVGDEDPELAALNAQNEEDSAITTSDEEE